MIWSFFKDGQRLRCEVRRDTDSEEYEFVVTRQGVEDAVTRFGDPTTLIEHSTTYLEELVKQGWRPTPSESA